MGVKMLEPGEVTLLQLEEIFWGGKVNISQECKSAVKKAQRVVEDIVNGDAAVYGVNTGFGKLASVKVAKEDTAKLQKNLILSHSAGVGDEIDREIVRLIMALKIISLARGASGVRWELIVLLNEMVNIDMLPVIPSQGSVGASGDLAPLAHMALSLIGEGKVRYQGKLMESKDALNDAGLKPIILGPKEGLALINGTQVSTAFALAGLFKTWRIARTSIVSGAISTEAAMGSHAPFLSEIHELRGQSGQIRVAKSLRSILSGSPIRESHLEGDERVQDPYCLRCQPQVLGAAIDQLIFAAKILEIEANAVTDNPLILSDGSIVSGGNFHAEPVGMAADQIAIAISEIGAISQRRIALLVDPALSFGLPAFLSPNAGLNSGFMIAEVTSAALMSENKALSNPRVVDSTPTSANQEDHVSMACHGAKRLNEMALNLAGIIGIEILAGSQGIELRAPLKTSIPLQKVISKLRTKVPFLTDDRNMSLDIDVVAKGVLHGNFCDNLDGLSLKA